MEHQLHANGHLWYSCPMTNSYLAVVSADGLQLLAPETKHARRFLLRRCLDVRRGHEACYWVCLQTEKVELIQWLMLCDQRRPALWLLNQLAIESGPVAPTADQVLIAPENIFAL